MIFSLTGIASVKGHYNAANKGVTQLVDFHKSYEAWFEADDVADVAAQVELMHAPKNNPLLKETLPIIGPEEQLASADLAKVLEYPSSPAMIAKIHQMLAILSLKQYPALTTQQLQAAAGVSTALTMKDLGSKSGDRQETSPSATAH